MRIVGIGIDIEEIERFKNEDLKEKILSSAEKLEYDAFKSKKRKQEYLASRFSAKEALYKTGTKLKMTDITIKKDENDKPYLNLDDNYHYEISLAHSNKTTVAVVIKMEMENGK